VWASFDLAEAVKRVFKIKNVQHFKTHIKHTLTEQKPTKFAHVLLPDTEGTDYPSGAPEFIPGF